jgi:hypothetical protein
MLIHVDLRETFPVLERLVQEADPTGMTLYRPAVLVASAFLAVALMGYFVRLKPLRSAEEAMQEAIDRRSRNDERVQVLADKDQSNNGNLPSDPARPATRV